MPSVKIRQVNHKGTGTIARRSRRFGTLKALSGVEGQPHSVLSYLRCLL